MANNGSKCETRYRLREGVVECPKRQESYLAHCEDTGMFKEDTGLFKEGTDLFKEDTDLFTLNATTCRDTCPITLEDIRSSEIMFMWLRWSEIKREMK